MKITKRNSCFIVALLSLLILAMFTAFMGVGQNVHAQGTEQPLVEVWLDKGCRRTYFLGDKVRIQYRASVAGTIQLWNYTQDGKKHLHTQYVSANSIYTWPADRDAEIMPPAGGEEQVVVFLEGKSAFATCRYSVYAEGDSPALPFPAPTAMPDPYLPIDYGPKVKLTPNHGPGCGGTYWLNSEIQMIYGATIAGSVRVRYVRPDGIHVTLQDLRPVVENQTRETFPVKLNQRGRWIFFAEMPGKGLVKQCVIHVPYKFSSFNVECNVEHHTAYVSYNNSPRGDVTLKSVPWEIWGRHPYPNSYSGWHYNVGSFDMPEYDVVIKGAFSTGDTTIYDQATCKFVSPIKTPCCELNYPQPAAVSPNMQDSLHLAPTTFTWRWSRALKADEYFQPQIIRNDVPRWDYYRGMMIPTKATQATVDLGKLFDNTSYDITTGLYCWRVLVVSTDLDNCCTTRCDVITFDEPVDGKNRACVCAVSEPTCVDP